MFNFDRYDYWVFDCDGVILQSNSIKSHAFFEVTKSFGDDKAQRFVAWHQAHGGISRYEKFDYFVKTILQKKTQEQAALADHLIQQYSTLCQQALLTCPLVPSVKAFLDQKPSTMPAYVVTGGDQREVRHVFKQRKIDHYFHSILGSPTSKRDNMQQLQEQGALTGRGLFFGDAALDSQLAKLFGLDFIFVSAYSEWREGKAHYPQHSIKNFTELLET